MTTPGNDDDEAGDGAHLAGLAEQFRRFQSREVDAMAAELAVLGPAAFLRNQHERALVAEAEEAAQGWRAVTITMATSTAAPRWPPSRRSWITHVRVPRASGSSGGSDFVTLRIPGPGADDVVSEVAEVARAHARRYQWWQVELSSRPGRR